MIVRIITCKVKPGSELTFEVATRENHVQSLTEPGVLRFDVLKDTSDSETYYLYEVYADEAATLAHKETAHYQTWRAAVEPCMATKRTSAACSVVAPVEQSAW